MFVNVLQVEFLRVIYFVRIWKSARPRGAFAFIRKTALIVS